MTKLQTEHEQKLQEMKNQSKKREEELKQEVNIHFFMLIVVQLFMFGMKI